ncbi:hypothetical protein DE4585_00463 [Mycobacteroides salmoniphilum]|uniref:Uncharacterized protein n=1 Tax=Mycobacteroides salmoniphilum TaxID=404941 RepID=A0A4R8S7M3_9MYCO|nr:hypothetical protein DE4585_00463 [Mycobacteroides salmoniphilum]
MSLTYWRLLPGFQPSALVPLSFPHTAAGQLRIHTGFPLAISESTFPVLSEKPMRGQNYHSNAQSSRVD